MAHIAIVLATRGQPARAAAVMEGARALASGDHIISCIVSCDDDDPAGTASFFAQQAYRHVRVDCRPRPLSPTECWNRVVLSHDAEYFLVLTDDAFVATPNWDRVGIARLAGYPFKELQIAALTDLANPNQATLFFVSRCWIAKSGFFDTRFPFWFSDTAIAETFSFVTGSTMPFAGITVASKGGRWNPRLRDMDLWWDLFAATRSERLATAAALRHKLGLLDTPRYRARLDELLRNWQARDETGRQLSHEIVRLLEVRGQARPPHTSYAAIKAQAEIYLQGRRANALPG